VWGIELLEEAVKQGCREAVSSGRPEAVLREFVQPALADLLAGGGFRSVAHDEARLSVPAPFEADDLDAPLVSYGRADAIYNRFVIEFEPPGALRPSLMHSATRHAVGQVKQYLRGLSGRDGLPLERLAGCAFDGYWIVYVSFERGEWHEVRPRPVDREALQALLDTLASLSTGRGLTADNLEQDFGRASAAARRLVRLLFRELEQPSQRTEAMFRQWSHDLGVASGPFSTADLADWQTICEELGVPPESEKASQVLFALQTYFSLVAKLVALVILEGVTGHELVSQLSEADDVFVAFESLESGKLTAVTGALNVVEPGVFSWYVYARTGELADALSEAAALAKEYSAEVVEVTPLAVRDVLKDLYQRLLPRSIRHRLGEYYTPDWLAQRVVGLVLSVPTPFALGPETRVVDPACGTGTFLVEVIGRQVEAAPDDAKEQTLELILRNVVGFDVSPLAVQAAKVNYLLALAPLLRSSTKPILLPVFMADSVSPPRRGALLEGDIYVFDSSEGSWEIPGPVVDGGHLMEVGEVLTRALLDEASRSDVEAQLAARLPAACSDPAVATGLGALYEKILGLHRVERNGMWWQILGNAFAPMLQGTFDLVIGNPPWVSWETLPEPYRRLNDSQWLQYGLRPDIPPERRQASRQVPVDLSMLFVARSMDKLLRDGGRLGFVITASAFKSELAGRGFRRRRLPSASYRLCHVEDLSRLAVFDHAANQTALMIAVKEANQSFPITVVEWSKGDGHSRSIPTSLELDAVLAMTRRTELAGEPVSPHDEATPLLVLPRPGLDATRDLRHSSFYADRVRNGIHTRGANGIFFLEILDQRPGEVKVRNLAGHGRYDAVPVIEDWIEADAVRLLLRGTDVQPGRADPQYALLFLHDGDHLSKPISDVDAARRFPAAYAYAKQFESLLRARHRFRNFDPTGTDWLGLYSVTRAAVAMHKVVYREISGTMTAAAVHSERIIPDHKLYVIDCETAPEADWLAEVINSDVVARIGRAFTMSTSISGSFLRYVGIRRLSGQEPPSTYRRRIERALGLGGRQLELIREALDVIAGLDADVDGHSG